MLPVFYLISLLVELRQPLLGLLVLFLQSVHHQVQDALGADRREEKIDGHRAGGNLNVGAAALRFTCTHFSRTFLL